MSKKAMESDGERPGGSRLTLDFKGDRPARRSAGPESPSPLRRVYRAAWPRLAKRCCLWLVAAVLLGWLNGDRAANSQQDEYERHSGGGGVLFQDRFEQPDCSQGWHPVTRWGGGIEVTSWASDLGRRGGGCLAVNAVGERAGWEKEALSAVPGAFYEVRGWVKASLGDGGAGLGIAFAGRNGQIVQEINSEMIADTTAPRGAADSTLTSRTGWKRVRVSATAPAAAALVTFFCWAVGSGQALFDDITGSISLPPALRLTSWEFPKTVVQGDTALVRLSLTADEDLTEPPSVAVFVFPRDSSAPLVRNFQRLVEPGQTWQRGARKEIEMCVLAAGHRYPPGRYLLRLELRNARWAEGREDPQREFEIVPGRASSLAPSLGPATYEGPLEARAGEQLRFSLRTTSAVSLPSGRAFAWLLRGEELWAAAAFPFAGGKGEIRLDRLAMDLPAGLPPGEYQLGMGIVGTTCEGKEPQDCSLVKLRIRVGSKGADDSLARPLAHGVFLDPSHGPHFWWVNQQGTLFWDAEPYLPVGVVYSPSFLRDYDPEREPRNEANRRLFADTLEHLRVCGLSDLLIAPGRPLADIPSSVLQEVVDELELRGFRYGMELNSGPNQPLRGYWLNSGISLHDVASGMDYAAPPPALPLPEKADALWVALDAQGKEVLEAGRATLSEKSDLVQGGRFVLRLKRPGAANATVFLTPEVELDASSPQQNLWEGFDQSVGQTCQLLASVHFGPGLRFFIDPLRTGLSYGFPPLLPDSKGFRKEYREWLKSQFGTIQGLEERWSLSGPHLESFDQAANLVPMALSGETGLVFLDAEGGPEGSSPQAAREPPLVFRMDLARSPWWLDWLDFRDQSVAEKLNSLASQVKEVVNVPVVVRQSGACAPYHVAWASGTSGIDGVADNHHGSVSPQHPTSVVAAYGTAAQSAKALWCLATVGCDQGPEAPPSGVLSSRGDMTQELLEILSLGAKGVFFSTGPAQGAAEPSPLFQPETLGWLLDLRQRTASASDPLSRYGPPLCYWLPANRLEDSIFSRSPQGRAVAQQILMNKFPFFLQGRWIVPAWRVPDDLSPLIVAPGGLPSALKNLRSLARALDQNDRLRACIGDLSFPEGFAALRKYFSLQVEPDSDGALVQALIPTPSSEVLGRTPLGAVWHLLDGTLEILSKTLPAGSEDEPGSERILPADSLRILDIPPQERYHPPVEFGREFLGLP